MAYVQHSPPELPVLRGQMPTDFVKIEQKSNMATANYPDQAGPGTGTIQTRQVKKSRRHHAHYTMGEALMKFLISVLFSVLAESFGILKNLVEL